MKRVRYPAEFKAEAVRQGTGRGHGVAEVAERLGVSDKSLYLWARQAKEQQSRQLCTMDIAVTHALPRRRPARCR